MYLHHFCLRAVGADRKIETEDQSGRNEPFPHQTLAGGFLENHRLFGSESQTSRSPALFCFASHGLCTCELTG